MKTFEKIIYWFLIIVAVIQFIPVNRTNEPVDKKQNFVDLYQTPRNIRQLLKNACYDCHSNETVYPDYAYVAPISWSINEHVKEGREHLNFSKWGGFNKELKKSMLENTIADLQQKRMPIAGYKVYHPKSKLTDSESELLIKYFEEILKTKNY